VCGIRFTYQRLAPMPLSALPAPDAVSASLPWLVAEWKSILLLVSLLMSALWIWWRTGSTHVFSALLWRRLLSRAEPRSRPLDEFLEERDELMRFRALTGLTRAPTLAAAERIAAWSREHDLDIELVSVAQARIDFRIPGLRGARPMPLVVATLGLAAGVLLLVAALVVVFGLLTPAALKVTQSQTWYKVQPDRGWKFEDWFSDDAPKFYRSRCSDRTAIGQRTGYVRDDIEVLCALMTGEEGMLLIKEARTAQAWLGIAIAAVIAVVGWLLRLTHRALHAASVLHDELSKDESQATTKPVT
jgi:hypothetical protein